MLIQKPFRIILSFQLVIIFLAVLGASFLTIIASADESTDKELERMVNVWRRQRLIIDIQPQDNNVRVNPIHWKSLTYSQQESTSKALAMYCSHKQNAPTLGTGWVEIKDGFSGKRLAKYGSWGYQTED